MYVFTKKTEKIKSLFEINFELSVEKFKLVLNIAVFNLYIVIEVYDYCVMITFLVSHIVHINLALL